MQVSKQIWQVVCEQRVSIIPSWLLAPREEVWEHIDCFSASHIQAGCTQSLCKHVHDDVSKNCESEEFLVLQCG